MGWFCINSLDLISRKLFLALTFGAMAPSVISSSTPPMAAPDRRESYDSCDSCDSDSYFSQTYVPLSNLPTPPLLSHSSSSSRDDIPLLDLDGDLESCLLGPACYLKNLIPSAVSLVDPSINTVHSILASASLPLPTIALAVCILDSLNSRFALSWRRSFPLTPSESPVPQQPHIDSVHPEVIILAALIISVKFLEDDQSTTMLCSRDWGFGRWSCNQINATEHAILENLGYRLLPLWNKELIGDALEEMERAGRYASRRMRHSLPQLLEMDLKAVFPGNAVWSAERQLTPAETPLVENAKPILDLAAEARNAFVHDHDTLGQHINLPKRSVGENFPLYADPFLNL